MMRSFFLLILFAIISNFSNAQNDSIKLANGQILLGQIESLDQSILVFSTSFSDSDFKIKWWKVKEIYSAKEYIISLSDGRRFSTTINTDTIQKNNVILLDDKNIVKTEITKVTSLDPLSESFLKRLDAAFDAGINLTKANNSQQITANGLLGYTTFNWNLLATANLVFGKQDNTDDIQRYEGNLSAQRFLPHDWYVNTGVDFLSNSDQQLKLRTTTRLGAGYFIAKNNSLYFGAGAGLAYNNESYSNLEDDKKSSLESYIAAKFNKYDIGNLSILTSAVLSPSITEAKRLRLDFKFNLKYDLTSQIYIKTGITYNYDNQPITGSSKGDYVFQTTFGWDND